MKAVVSSFVLMMCLSFIGCSGSNEMQIGEERIVERSTPEVPSWISIPSEEKDGYFYASGQISKAKDRSFGMIQANADGVKKLLNTMTNKVGGTVAQALGGANYEDNDVGRFTQDVVGWISDTYKFRGVTTPATYWEKWMKKTQSGVEYYYHCYCQLRISRLEYDNALNGAYNEIKRKAQSENNVKNEEAAKKLLEKLEKQ
ncbi:MAG: hypothetical protein Q8N83_00040 [Ignavibacteria bacterium]|nr:hypothetical protein [Ignavibacteria bacterium]